MVESQIAQRSESYDLAYYVSCATWKYVVRIDDMALDIAENAIRLRAPFQLK